ncbi:MAG: Rieske 2Fe-2S domain-containing protein, partial [Caulobacteraceae bacterium]|nr:Rieske 2Fe-2S domain-containing protein [Caulobacteraceae bacterium]
MLTRDDNELMCRVEPGYPMHDAFKRYWLIAGMSEDHPLPDSDPKRSTLLGEDYVLFRDSSGRMACLRELCCHRGASLCLGRVE